MKKINLENYYNKETQEFITSSSKEELENFLHDSIEDVMGMVNSIFGNQPDFMAETMKSVKVEVDEKTLIPSKYIPSIEKIVATLETCDNSETFIQKYRAGMNENELKEELCIVLNNLKDSKNELRAKLLINSYLNHPSKPGMYYEDENKVVLYLKEISKKENASDYLMENFAHELFHGFHYFMTNKKFSNSWKYTDYQDDAVKEGLAKYIEFQYLRFGDYQNDVFAIMNEKGLEQTDFRDFPFASYNILKGKEELFKEVFNISLKDMGDAYNLLLVNSNK